MGRPFVWIAACASFIAPAAAQAKQDTQLWSTASATLKLSSKWRMSEELVVRFSDTRKGLYEIESNTLVGYRLSKVTTVWAGYTHNPQYAGGTFTIMERRAREQVTFDGFAKVGPGKLSGRLRLEGSDTFSSGIFTSTGSSPITWR